MITVLTNPNDPTFLPDPPQFSTDAYALSLGLGSRENLSGAISWFTFLLADVVRPALIKSECMYFTTYLGRGGHRNLSGATSWLTFCVLKKLMPLAERTTAPASARAGV
jgi:hypothetical protein